MACEGASRKRSCGRPASRRRSRTCPRRPPVTQTQPNLELLPLLSTVLCEDDPGGHPFPLVTAGMTDARRYDQLGIQTYGFLPMKLPPGRLPKLLHAPNERVPAAALAAGAAAVGRVIKRYRAP